MRFSISFFTFFFDSFIHSFIHLLPVNMIYSIWIYHWRRCDAMMHVYCFCQQPERQRWCFFYYIFFPTPPFFFHLLLTMEWNACVCKKMKKKKNVIECADVLPFFGVKIESRIAFYSVLKGKIIWSVVFQNISSGHLIWKMCSSVISHWFWITQDRRYRFVGK